MMGWFVSPRSPEQIAADIAAWTAEQDRLAARSKLRAWWEDAKACVRAHNAMVPGNPEEWKF